ncbi:hypothetical protein BDW02DRAFT_580085 [Decorospora gaudefroyi]|uniref:Uncharacterized protein n=1 Tax=Decorospora gaudefroyi TaxID=184978 RepID=A0A6A5KF18_9PLEO|nr:hypothetical protein BDW02DRAFT_580085 [Decorospora gaudefroyi]
MRRDDMQRLGACRVASGTLGGFAPCRRRRRSCAGRGGPVRRQDDARRCRQTRSTAAGSLGAGRRNRGRGPGWAMGRGGRRYGMGRVSRSGGDVVRALSAAATLTGQMGETAAGVIFDGRSRRRPRTHTEGNHCEARQPLQYAHADTRRQATARLFGCIPAAVKGKRSRALAGKRRHSAHCVSGALGRANHS